MPKTQFAAFLALFLAFTVTAGATVCDARAFGAKPDGKTLNTAFIQAAIDACAKTGGTVELSGGVFLSAPIVLKSNITLDIAKGTTLLGTTDHSLYPPLKNFRLGGLQPLVSATHAENITITGGGTIDGAGQTWWAARRAAKAAGKEGKGHGRPHLVAFNYCKHVHIEGITVQNSPSWQIVPYYSDDVTISHVKILADPHSPNTDAIDPFSSTNVTIDHVLSDVGDDNIAIKSGQPGSPGPDSPSSHITITDCTFLHGHGLSIGSELAGGANNIVASNIDFRDTTNGVRVKSNRDRGNDIGPITFRNLTMHDVKIAILISEYYPTKLSKGDDKPQPLTRLTPHFHDITIENLKAVGSTDAGVIIGLPESPIKNVVLRNVSIQAKDGLIISNADVSGEDVVVQSATGKPITVAPSAHVKLSK